MNALPTQSAATAAVQQLHFDVIDSTNAEALRRADQLADRALISCTRQTAGRGRRGRIWQSPGTDNLCLSLFARLSKSPQQLAGLSLAVAIELVERLRAEGLPQLQVKWPNDLQVEGRKLGGILIELAATPAPGCAVVIGLGLNVALPDSAEIDQPWIDLQSLGLCQPRAYWQALASAALLAAVDGFEAQGFAAYWPRWSALDALAGQTVRISGGARTGGEVLGISGDGALRLRDAQGEWQCQSGEASLQR